MDTNGRKLSPQEIAEIKKRMYRKALVIVCEHCREENVTLFINDMVAVVGSKKAVFYPFGEKDQTSSE